jgi:ribose transport system permease protein
MTDGSNRVPASTEIPNQAPNNGGASANVMSPHARERSGKVVDFAERFGLVVVWGMVVLAFTLYEPSIYLSVGNIANILGSQAVLVVMTLGLLLPMTAGDFDLSVGGVVALSSMVIAVLNTQHGWPILAAAGVAIVLGGLVGLFNGIIITVFSIDSLIVTLGVQTLLSGVVLWLSNAQTVSGVSSTLVQYVVADRWFGIPLEFYYATGITIVIWCILDFTLIGRKLLFVGRGREVARLSGVRVARTRIIALVMSGVVSAVAGVLYVGTTGAADPSSAFNFLLPAFAASFLGFTAIRPGRFNAWGTYIAVYFLISGITGLELAGIAAFVQELFYGAALILAVVLRQIVRGRQEAGA